jgi:hypothetical protein
MTAVNTRREPNSNQDNISFREIETTEMADAYCEICAAENASGCTHQPVCCIAPSSQGIYAFCYQPIRFDLQRQSHRAFYYHCGFLQRRVQHFPPHAVSLPARV